MTTHISLLSVQNQLVTILWRKLVVTCLFLLIIVLGTTRTGVSPTPEADAPDNYTPQFDFVENIPTAIPNVEELSTYRINVTFSPSNHKAFGWVNVSYLNTEVVTLEEVYFHIWPNALLSNGLVVGTILDGQETGLVHSIEDQVNLRVNLPSPLASGARTDLKIPFNATLPNNPDRYGYQTNPFLVSAFANWHPILSVFEDGQWNKNPYAHSGEAFFSDEAYYDVWVVAPVDQKIAAAGDLVNVTIVGNQKIHHWTAGPIRDFTWVAGSGYEVSTLHHNNVTIMSYYFPEHASRGLAALHISKKSLDLFSDIFEPYPYKTMVIVELQAWFGGMEYCQLIMITNRYYEPTSGMAGFESVISHEWSHTWNTYIVANNPWADPWFDEGWAMYSSILYFEEFYSESYARNQLVKDKQAYLTYVQSGSYPELPLGLGMSYWDSNAGSQYYYGIYIKGEVFWDTLRLVMGDNAFFDATKELWDLFSYKTINRTQVEETYETASGQELSWLFEALDRPVLTELSLASSTFQPTTDGLHWNVSLRILQSKPITPLPLHLSVEFTLSDDSSVRAKVWVNESDQTVYVILPIDGLKPKDVVLDPDWVLLRHMNIIDRHFSSGSNYSTPNSPSLNSVALTSEGVELTWSMTDDGGLVMLEYEVYRRTDSGNFQLLGKVNERSFLDPTTEQGTVYTYTIAAVNALGTSPRSNELTIMDNGTETTTYLDSSTNTETGSNTDNSTEEERVSTDLFFMLAGVCSVCVMRRMRRDQY